MPKFSLNKKDNICIYLRSEIMITLRLNCGPALCVFLFSFFHFFFFFYSGGSLCLRIEKLKYELQCFQFPDKKKICGIQFDHWKTKISAINDQLLQETKNLSHHPKNELLRAGTTPSPRPPSHPPPINHEIRFWLNLNSFFKRFLLFQSNQ